MSLSFTPESIQRAVERRWKLVLGMTASCVAIAAVSILITPAVYHCQSLVTVPETNKFQLRSDAIGNVAGLINVAEAQVLIGDFLKELQQGSIDSMKDRTVLKRIKDVRAENIVGSNSYIQLHVRVKGDPALAVLMSERILEYLRGNEYVKGRIEMESDNLTQALGETKRSLDNANETRRRWSKSMSPRDNYGFNPIDLDIRISELSYRYYQIKTDLSMIHTFEFVKKPFVTVSSKRRQMLISGVAFFFIGLVLGVTLVWLLEGRTASGSR